jgi:O-antigen/teichoic acid export membrane protein
MFVIFFQLINIKLYTNYLNVEQLGIFFFLLAVSYSANAILFVPLDYFQQAKLTKVITDFGGARSLLSFNSRIVGIYVCFALLLIFGCLMIQPNYTAYVALVMMFALALYVVQALRNTLNNLGYSNCVSVSFIQEAFLKVVVLYIFIYIAKPDAMFLIIAWLSSLISTVGYLWFNANKHKVFSGSDDYVVYYKEIFLFSYPFSIGAVCNWLQLQGYRLVLVPLGYSEVVGIFATLSGIGSAAIGAASLIYSQQFTPRIYKTEGAYTAKYLKGAFVVIIAVTLVSFALGDFMVKILTHPEFEPHWKLLLFGVLTDAANLIVGGLAIHITLRSSTKIVMGSSLIGLMLMFGSFSILYTSVGITVNTVGIPLLISQWSVVAYMYWKFSNSRIRSFTQK